ncbi:unnamed protein product [Caenorhabditis brenneri]
MDPIHPSLAGVPPETLDKICKFLDYNQILGLRPVCRRLKNYVDNCRPDFGHQAITIIVVENGYRLSFMTKSRKLAIINCVDGNEDQWRPLEVILSHQKSLLNCFSIDSWARKNQKGFSELLEKIEPCLMTRVRQLQVTQFRLLARHEKDVMSILPYLDPGFLQKIELTLYISKENKKRTLELGRIKELEHWKMTNRFEAPLFFIDAKIEEFEHFEKFVFRMDTLKMSDVAAWKEKIFTHSIKTTYAQISYRNLLKDAEIPPGHLPIDESNPDVYEYPISDGKKQRLYLKLTSKFLRISFFHCLNGVWYPAF